MKISKLRKSRDNWKGKATYRGSTLRNSKKASERKRKRSASVVQYEDKIRRLEEENSELESKVVDLRAKLSAAAIAGQPIQHRSLCVFTVTWAIVSFRSVPRILKIFKPLLKPHVQIPHFTSVINWTVRAGIAAFSQVGKVKYPWVCLMDFTIDVGTRKALTVLRVPLGVLQAKHGAIGPEDCECIGLEIASKWNGPLVCEALDRVFRKAGFPVGIIKDGGGDLKKGVELLCEKRPEQNIKIIDDVGHFAANALKAVFAKAPLFIKFLSIVTTGAKRIRQTNLAYLLPPKIRSKGRFQGVTVVAKWAEQLLEVIGGKGKAKTESDAGKARKAFEGLAKLRPFLARFIATCTIVESFLKLMKNEGLSETTYTKAKKILRDLPKKSIVKQRLSEWLEKHIGIHRTLDMGDMALLVSSDAIESVFGKFKTIIQRNTDAELNRLAFVTPLLCGRHSQQDIELWLQKCSHKQMREQIKQTIPPTLRQKRIRDLKNNGPPGPKSGGHNRRE